MMAGIASVSIKEEPIVARFWFRAKSIVVEIPAELLKFLPRTGA
jgi:hypothetical protein